MAKLILESGHDPKLSYHLEKQRVTIGRDASNQIVLSDPSVSHVHAEITFNGKFYRIQDLESTNGVFVNNERMKKRDLCDKDRIRVGDTTFVYVEHNGEQSHAAFQDAAPFSEISIPFFAIRDLEMVRKDFEKLQGPAAAQKEPEDYSLLSAFYQLNRALTQEKDFKEMVQDVLRQVLQTVKADTGIVFLRHSHKGVLEPFLAVGGQEEVSVEKIQFSKTLLMRAMDSGEGILTSNAMSDERFQGVASVMANNIVGAMCVPVRTRKETFGVIQVDVRSPHPGFTKSHLEVLMVMAREIAVCFENIRLRNELKLARESLQNIDKMRENFIGVIGYQIATPITVMDQYFRLLKDGLLGQTRPEQDEALEVLLRHSERLKCVVRDLERVLSWDILAKKIRWTMGEFDLVEVVDALLEEIQPLFNAKSQRFSWVRPAKPVKLVGNKEAVGEVLAHLLINAYKFTPEKTEIFLTMQDEPQRVVVQVEDRGVGMSPEVAKQVFDSFFVGDKNLAFTQTAPKYLSRSLGLGLYLSKKIVEKHGGKIWVDSEVGKFCRFAFFLPKRPPKEAS